MTVPEAAMEKDCGTVFREDKIGLAGKFGFERKAQAKLV